MNLSLIPLPQSKGRTKRVVTKPPLGLRPEFHFDYSASKGISRQSLNPWSIDGFENQHIDVDLSRLASNAGRALLAVETDWVNLAIVIYATDRFANRRPGRSAGQTYWRRSIILSVSIPPGKALGLIKMERYARRIAHCFGPSAPDDSAMWEYPEAGSYFGEAAKSLDLSLEDYLSGLRKLHQSFVLEWRNFAANLPALRRVA